MRPRVRSLVPDARSARAGLRWAAFAAAAVILAGCAGSRPPVLLPEGAPSPAVRVGLLLHVNEARVGAPEPYTLADASGILAVGKKGEAVTVRRDGNRILVFAGGAGLLVQSAGPLRLAPDDRSGEVKAAGRDYPGRLEIVISPSGGMNVVNVVDVENYLRQVVPREIGHAGDGYREAAKAQAVAARTYVAGRLGSHPGEGYDVEAGVGDQVYGTVDERHPDADRAVAETRGLILVKDGKPIRANYSSTCGGKIAAVEESFDADPVSYLREHDDKVNGQDACRTSKYYRWEESWSGTELVKILARTIPAVLGKPFAGTAVEEVKVTERGKSGRAVRLRIKTDRAEYTVRKGAIRRVLDRGSGPLWSTWFDLDVKRSGGRVKKLTARGRGWGHGVGMCQWGAMQLSRDGLSFERILEHYYPGTELKPWDHGLSARRGETS